MESDASQLRATHQLHFADRRRDAEEMEPVGFGFIEASRPCRDVRSIGPIKKVSPHPQPAMCGLGVQSLPCFVLSARVHALQIHTHAEHGEAVDDETTDNFQHDNLL